MTSPLFAVMAASALLVGPPPPAVAPTAASEDAEAADLDLDRARRVAAAAFAEGVDAFERGDYETAATAFRAADDWMSHPHTRFNLGLALRAAQRPIEAWTVLHAVEGESRDPQERAEVRRELDRLEAELALLTVVADPEARLCLDGAPMLRDADGRSTVATAPGAHRLWVDGAAMALELQAGRERVLHLEHARQLRSTRHPATTPLVGVAAGSALLSTGLGIAGLSVSDDARRTQLAGVAIGTAAVAAATGLAALILSERKPVDDVGATAWDAPPGDRPDLQAPCPDPFDDPVGLD